MNYFTDPILFAPTLGCLFMCVATSLIGVILLLQKRLLVGETVAHAAYPGALLGLLALSLLGPALEEYAFLAVLLGALVSAWLGLRCTEWLQRRSRIPSDSALCLVLALFFGCGILLASWLQAAKPLWRAQVDMLLFGQAATLTDLHVGLYAALALSAALFVALWLRPLQAVLFDAPFARSVGLKTALLERLIFWLLLGSVVVGIRSVGVVLISGMLIAPAIAARCWTRQLKSMFGFAALFGALSALCGHALSVEVALRWPGVHLPTGPAIVLVGSTIAVFSLALAPERGALRRWVRRVRFHLRCLEENLLKDLWKKETLPLRSRSLRRRFVVFRLIAQGWAVREGAHIRLTADGQAKAAAIVRLHRLWEVYLTDQLGVHAEKVHRSAEEMEHILTPELEERLTRLLGAPQVDPHQQPIPQKKAAL